MRLIHTKTLQVHIFEGDALIPRYATLSHTWEEGEVVLPDLYDRSLAAEKTGFRKLQQACSLAQELSIDWLWTDTVCIDRSSSAELSEAINAAFSWYRESDVCFAYLSDFQGSPSAEDPDDIEDILASCRWMKRSWTLAELIAAPKVDFYDYNWSYICTKSSMLAVLERVTKIDSLVLQDPDCLPDFSVARRMYWACSRSARRPEDASYALFGIFGINMPIIYGEGGQKAFLRLQEELLKDTDDASLFAWKSADPLQQYRGLLAISPLEFSHCGSFLYAQPWRIQGDMRVTSGGIHIAGLFWYRKDDPDVLMALSVEHGTTKYGLWIILTKWKGSYVRARPASILRVSSEKLDSLRGHRGRVCVKRHLDSRTSSIIAKDVWQANDHELPIRQASQGDNPPPSLSERSGNALEQAMSAQCTSVPAKRYYDESDHGYDPRSSEEDSAMEDSEPGDDDMDLFMTPAEQPPVLDPDHRFAKLLPDLAKFALQSFQQWISGTIGSSKRPNSGVLSPRSCKRLRSASDGGAVEVDQQTDSEDDDTVVVNSTPLNILKTWACPFYVRNPKDHQDCLFGTDLLRTIRDVKAHLGAAHRRPIFCPRCFTMFDTGVSCDDHIRARTCTRVDGPGYDGITHMQIAQLAEKFNPEASPEEHWFNIWKLVFPREKQRPPSPFFAAQGQIESVVCAVREYWAKEGKSIVTTILEERGLENYNTDEEEKNVIALGAAVIRKVVDDLVNMLRQDGEVEESWGVWRIGAIVDKIRARPKFEQ